MKAFTSLALSSAVAMVLLSGCANSGPSEQHQLTGSLSYLSRIALAPNSIAEVTIRDTSEADGKIIAEQRIELEGQELPIPFTLELNNQKLDAGTYSLSALIKEQSRLSWRSAPVGVSGKLSDMALGNLQLQQVTDYEFNSLMQCGEQRIHVAFADELALLRIKDQTLTLEQVIAASGARYQLANDPSTELWNKGDKAQLKVKGKAYPECVSGADASDTTAILQGGEWQVTNLNGEDVSMPADAEEPSEGSLNFNDEGRLFGRAFCNNVMGNYQLNGDKLSTDQLAGTMMMCTAAQMKHERTMLDVLGHAKRIEFTAEGELVIFAADGKTLTAR
ncbi:META domain-containing protein [Oceanisphaera sp. W20_SRM_FM3]|uniref:META domain-containing protein n=1 Tax=Oceanisphaera sp. W20_SRM_FM3 TaxID=3240267 RepID=UPI003F9E35B9